MATRFYFAKDEVAAVNPPNPDSGDWEHIPGALTRRRLLLTPDASALSTVSDAPDAADHLVDADALRRIYVSDVLPAQSVSAQTIAMVMQGLMANSTNHLFLTTKLYAVSADGTTNLGTLQAITRDNNEYTTSLINRFLSTNCSPVTLSQSWRLVVEVGYGGLPTTSAGVDGHNGSLRFGCDASSGDLPADNTTTGTTYRPWIEFESGLNLSAQATFAPPLKHQADMGIVVTAPLTQPVHRMQASMATLLQIPTGYSGAVKHAASLSTQLFLPGSGGAGFMRRKTRRRPH